MTVTEGINIKFNLLGFVIPTERFKSFILTFLYNPTKGWEDPPPGDNDPDDDPDDDPQDDDEEYGKKFFKKLLLALDKPNSKPP